LKLGLLVPVLVGSSLSNIFILALYRNKTLKPFFFFLAENEFKLNDLAFEYLNGFKLICVHAGWDWTRTRFLKELLGVQLDELHQASSLKPDHSASSTVSFRRLELMAFYYLLQANLVAHLCPKTTQTPHAIVHEIIKTFAQHLQSDETSKGWF
jgi:hypothetical protein